MPTDIDFIIRAYIDTIMCNMNGPLSRYSQMDTSAEPGFAGL